MIRRDKQNQNTRKDTMHGVVYVRHLTDNSSSSFPCILTTYIHTIHTLFLHTYVQAKYIRTVGILA